MSSVQSWFVLTMSHCVVSFPNHLYLFGILCNDFYSLKIYFFVYQEYKKYRRATLLQVVLMLYLLKLEAIPETGFV